MKLYTFSIISHDNLKFFYKVFYRNKNKYLYISMLVFLGRKFFC